MKQGKRKFHFIKCNYSTKHQLIVFAMKFRAYASKLFSLFFPPCPIAYQIQGSRLPICEGADRERERKREALLGNNVHHQSLIIIIDYCSGIAKLLGLFATRLCLDMPLSIRRSKSEGERPRRGRDCTG